MFSKHKKNFIYIIILSVIFITTNIFLIYNYAHKKKHNSNAHSKIDIIDNKKNNVNIKFENTSKSNELESPWQDDKNFQELQNKYNLHIKMASFRTVLPDPLPGEEYNVTLGASLLCGKVILPGETFSLNKTLGPYSKEKGFREGPTYSGNNLITTIGGGMCKIATTLYNLAQLSNLQIIERHPHSMIVQYVPLGQDATVSYGSKDLRFKNTTSSPILIWGVNKDKILYMSFYGKTSSPKVDWNHKILNTKKKRIISKKTKSVPKDTTVVLEGCNGYTVKSWLTITFPDGSFKTKNIGIDHYVPMDEIILNND